MPSEVARHGGQRGRLEVDFSVTQDLSEQCGASDAAEGDPILWTTLQALKGQDLVTLFWSRQFTILDVTQNVVRIRLEETKRTKRVERTQLQTTLAVLRAKGALTLQDIRTYAPETSSYVAALLARVPGVTWDKGKQRLLLAGSLSSAPSDGPQVEVPPDQPSVPAGPLSFDAIWTQQGREVLGLWRKLSHDVQREIVTLALADAASLVRTIDVCESAPEQLLATRLISEARAISVIEGFELHPQYRVETRDGPFRVDFLVRGAAQGIEVQLAVECDGHTYHDRTKEQATRDRQRDRSLKLAGYEVVRFTASEVSADPEDCALEVFRHILALARTAGGEMDPERLAPSGR